jgi:chorismate dehydratase
MSESQSIPRLRLAAPETMEEIASRQHRERRQTQRRTEDELGDAVGCFRIGSVPYLNAVPLTRGLEDRTTFLPPAQLAAALRAGELDAALVSVTEVLLQDRFDVLDGTAVASLGEVKSVFLAHSLPLEEIREVYCDPASLTSVLLLRVLLAERGVRPTFQPLTAIPASRLPEAMLLIGDAALEYLLGPHEHEIWDLGDAWHEATRLPFVYAVWALRRDPALAPLCRLLREARSFGLDTLEAIIAERKEFTLEFRKDYLGWHIHYHLGDDERRGLHRFKGLLEKHGLGPVYELRYV